MNKSSKSIIFTVIFIDLLGFGIVIPLIPTYASKLFSAPDFEIGLLIASFSFAQFIFSSVWGRLSDEIGRKPVILISLIGNVIAYVLFGLAQNLTMLFISRILAGICAGSISAAQAYMADISAPKDRAKSMGLVGMAFSLGFIFGPFLGGMLSKYGHQYPGFFAAGLSLIALIFALIWLNESLDKEKVKLQIRRKFNLTNFIDALRHPNIGILLVMFFVFMIAVSNVYSIIALFFYKNFGFSDQTNGIVLGYIGVIGAITQGAIGFLTKKYDERKLLIVGNLFAAIGILLLPFSSTLLFLLIILFIYGAGSGFIQTIIPSLISQFVEPEEQGGTLGLNQSLASLGRVIGPIWGGVVFDAFGHNLPFYTAGVAFLIVFIMSFFVKDKRTLTNSG